MSRKLKTAATRSPLTDFELLTMRLDFKERSAHLTFGLSSPETGEAHTYDVIVLNGRASSGGGLFPQKHVGPKPGAILGESDVNPAADAFDRLAALVPKKALREIEDLVEALGLLPG